MIELKQKLSALAEIVEAKNKLDANEKQAKADNEAALRDGNIESAKDLQRLSEAQMRLSLVPVRRKKLNQALKEGHKEVLASLKKASRDWSRFVNAKASDKFDEYIAAVMPFYDEPERAVRRHFDGFQFPAKYEIERASSEPGDLDQLSEEQLLHVAENFIGSVGRACKKFGWPEPA